MLGVLPATPLIYMIADCFCWGFYLNVRLKLISDINVSDSWVKATQNESDAREI